MLLKEGSTGSEEIMILMYDKMLLVCVIVSLLYLSPLANGADDEDDRKPLIPVSYGEPWPVVREEFASLMQAYDLMKQEQERAPSFVRLIKRLGKVRQPTDAVAEVLARYHVECTGRYFPYGKMVDFDKLFEKHFGNPCRLLIDMTSSKDSANLRRVRQEMTEPRFDWILSVCKNLLEPSSQMDLYEGPFKSELLELYEKSKRDPN